MSDDITKDEIREALGNSPAKKIVFAPKDQVQDLRSFIRLVLEAIDFETAWVSDESRLDDFPLDEEDRVHAEEKLGVPVNLSDYVVEVAKRVRDLHASQKGGGPNHHE